MKSDFGQVLLSKSMILLSRSKEKIINFLKSTYQPLNEKLFGVLDIFRIAGRHFSKERAPEAAASMAYYTFFSLFPLILVLISFASFILESQYIQDQIFTFLEDLIPVSPDLISNNIESVLSKRGAVGVIAMAGLMWSASNMFNTMSLNIDRAWPDNNYHNFFERRAIGFAILIGMIAIIVFFWFLKTIIRIEFIQDLLTFFKIPIFETTLWDLLILIAPRIVRFITFFIMFQWIPKARVNFSEAFWGAIITTVLNETITWLMNWYLGSQWVRYELVYGSLGRIIALLLWFYLTSYVILFGAHFSSAIAQVFRQNPISNSNNHRNR